MYFKEFEDTKGVIRIRISKTDRQYISDENKIASPPDS
jgi:hypothetical protein